MRCKNFLFILLIVLFSNFTIAEAQTITVQAETYTAATSGTTPIVLENKDATVGYFDEMGETLTYKINVTTAGYYQMTVKYLAGNSGYFVMQTANGAEGIMNFSAQNYTGGWWLMPLASWPTTAASASAYFYLTAGQQNLKAICKGTGLNMDYFELKYAANQNITISKIVVSPIRLELKQNRTKTVVARAVTSAGETVATPLTWSTNAPDGKYTSGSVDKTDEITVSSGSTTTKVKVDVKIPTKKRDFVVSYHGQLHTSGKGLADKNNTMASFAGPSWFWSSSAPKYWTADAVRYFVTHWKSGIVRMPMSINPCDDAGKPWNNASYKADPVGAMTQMETVIDAAIENDVYVVVDFHEHYAQNYTDLAKKFFTDISKTYGNCPNIIYEIYNEPKQDTDNSTVANYANQIIPIIRANSPNSVIVVGSTWYSQQPCGVRDAGVQGTNIAYTLHYYANQHQGSLLGNLTCGAPVMVTECGADGYAQQQYIDACKANGISHMTWAVNNKGRVSDTDPGDIAWSIFTADNQNFEGSTWTDSDLSDAGKNQKGIVLGWPRKVEPTDFVIPCDDDVVGSIEIVAPKTQVVKGRTLTLTAIGKSSCKDITLSSVTWSANAPGGVFTATTIGNSTVTVSTKIGGKDFTAEIAIEVIATPAYINIEAESFSSTSGDVKIDASTGKSIGYFGAAGESITFKNVDVFADGEYEVTFKYLAGTAGSMKLSATGLSSSTLAYPANTTVSPWYSAPSSAWTVSAPTKVTLKAGLQDITVATTGTDINLDYIQLKPLVVCTDDVLQSISIVAPKTTINVGESATLTVKGMSSCKEVPATPVTWTNATTGGVVSGQTVGAIKVTAKVGAFTAETTINVIDIPKSIKIEAESFTSETGGVKVENNQSIGYFGTAGNSVTYTVTVPAAGSYDLKMRYLSGSAGNITMSAAGGADQTINFTKNSTTADWWATPFASWTESALSTVTLPAGSTTLTFKNTGTGVNIDWFELTAKVICTDITVQSIKLSATKTSVLVNQQVQLSVVGKSSCQDVAVTGVEWSANAPGGVFVSSAEGSFDVTATVTINGKKFTDTITITVTNVVVDCATPVGYFGKMIAVGNRIHGSKTNAPMQVKGASFFWSNWSGQYWNTQTVDYMVDNMKVELLRCAWGVDDNGNAYSGDYSPLYTVVDQCIKRGIYVIIDWHAHTLDKNPGAASGFFNTMAAKYGKYDNVIFEMFNEPRQETSLKWPTIKSAQEQVLPSIRKYSDNLVIIGTPWFSQDVDIATADPIVDANAAYAIHWYVANHCAGVWNKIPVAMKNNKPLFGSEWGFWAKEWWSQCGDQNFDQNEVARLWMEKMDENMISWANWSIADKTAEQSSLFTGGFNLSNAGNWLKGNLDAWSKSDLNQWRKCCKDYTVIKTKLIVPKTTIGIGQELQMSLTGESSCKSGLAVPNAKWSANAPGGLFKGTTVGHHTVTVTAIGKTDDVVITVVSEPNTVVYKPSSGVMTELKTKWYSYSSVPSTVTKVAATSEGAKIDYAITVGKEEWDNTAGFGFNMVDTITKKPFNLTGSTGIKFRYKGPAFSLAAKTDTVDLNKDYCYHAATCKASVNGGFTEYTVLWSDFMQAGYGKQVGFLNESLHGVNGFQFTYAGATGDKGSMVISDVTLLDVNLTGEGNSLGGDNSVGKLLFYPNPSQGQLTIKAEQECTLQVIDIAGTVILVREISAQDNVIDLSGNKGMFLLRFSNKNGTTVEKLIIE